MARFAEAFSQHPDPGVATGEAIGALLEALPEPTAVVVMASGDMSWRLADVIEAVDALLSPEVLVGLTASAVRGQGGALSSRALAMWATDATGVRAVRLEADPEDPDGFLASHGLGPVDDEALLLWCDPETVDPDALVEWRPDLNLCAGLLTPVSTGGLPRLFLGQDEYDDGAVGLALSARVARCVVDRGARQIGDYWAVTSLDGSDVVGLAGTSLAAHAEELGLRASDCVLGPVAIDEAGDPQFAAPAFGLDRLDSPAPCLGDLFALWAFDPVVFDDGLTNSIDWSAAESIVGFGPPRHGNGPVDISVATVAAATTTQIGTFERVRSIYQDAFGAALFR